MSAVNKIQAPMNWSKLDAALAGALSERGGSDRPLTVFIHLDVESVDPDLLAECGIEADQRAEVCTATLSARQVEVLSDQHWVRLLRLSHPLRLMDGP